MDTPVTLTRGQKILAAGGIFLLVGIPSWYYGQVKPYRASQQEPVVAIIPGTSIPESELQYEANVPPVLNPQVTMPQNTQPAVSTGAVVSEVPSQALPQNPPAQPSSSIQLGAFPTLIPALQQNQITIMEDQAWDRSVFDDIFPFANLVSMRSYKLQQTAGFQRSMLGGEFIDVKKDIGRVTTITTADSTIPDVYAYILMLAKRDTSGKVSIEEKTYGQTKVFFYNHLDKKENLRILVQVNDKEAVALDLPAYLQGVMDSVLSQL